MRQILRLATGRTARNTIINLAGTVGYGFLIFAFIILAAQRLSPVEFGVFSLALTFYNLIPDLFSLGTSQAIVRFVSVYIGQRNFVTAMQYAKLIFLSRVLGAFIIIPAGLVLTPVITHSIYHTPQLFIPLLLAVIFSAFSLVVIFYQNLLVAYERFMATSALALIAGGLKLLSLLGLIFSQQVSLATISLAFFAPTLIVLVVAALVVSPDYLPAPQPLSVIKPLWKFSRWLALWGITASLASKIDILLLAKLSSLHQAGIYSAASRFAAAFTLVGGAIPAVLTPKFSRVIHLPDQLIRYFKYTIGGTLIVLVPMVLAILAAPVLLPLFFSPAYLASIATFQILTFGLMFFMAAIPANVTLLSLGKTHLIASLAVLQLLIVVISGWWLIPALGAQGAAIASSMGFAGVFIASLIAALCYLKLPSTL